MFKLSIKKNNIVTNELFDSTLEGIQSQLEFHKSINSFGVNEHSYEQLISEAIPAVLDEDGTELSPEVPAVYETVEIPAEYSVEIVDISEQLEQSRINTEALAYLAATDYLIIRELDAGIPCPPEIKQARAEARAKIVK